MIYAELAKEITNIRYAEDGKINFDFRGHVMAIREPRGGVLLVGFDGAAEWLALNYGFVLDCLKERQDENAD